jgi:acyl phosphate:glycerol-3-phosphate acyltransferase
VVCGLTAVVGHSLSPFLKFKGGKGVSTGLGAILGSCPVVALIAFGIFLVLLAMTRYVSLGSLVAAASLPISAGIFGYSYTVIGLMAATALLVISRHRGNIERLRNGTERKFNPRGKSSEPSEPPEESEEK